MVTAILVKAKTSDLRPLISNDLPPHRRWGADAALRAVANDEKADPRERLRASLAMLPVDTTQIGYLKARLLDCSMETFPTIRSSLDPYLNDIAEGLWTTLRSNRHLATSRLRAGMTLASFAPSSDKWTGADDRLPCARLARRGAKASARPATISRAAGKATVPSRSPRRSETHLLQTTLGTQPPGQLQDCHWTRTTFC